MPAERWRFAIQLLREDHSPVRQLPVELDWDPLRESLRFTALREGLPPAIALALDCEIEPIWDRNRGEPFLEGVRARSNHGAVEISLDVRTEVFHAPAKAMAAELVKEGALQDGDQFRSLPMAFAESGEVVITGNKRFKARPIAPSLDVVDASLADFVARAGPPLGAHAEPADDVPVFIPQDVLDEARELTRTEEARETGGLLIGHLRRDREGAGLFLEVTAQLPARHVEADRTRLTFTSDTWTEFRSALELRRRGEIMLGWWHSHPVREWCKSCSEESQRKCALRGDFLSDDDRLLHRTIFPRAYSLALVVNDVAYEEPTYSMFGWQRGTIQLRGYRVLDACSQETATATALAGASHA